MLEIYYLGDEELTEKCTPVKKIDDSTAVLAEAMFETMYEKDGVGLAGPQVGVPNNIFVVDTRKEGEKFVFINPQIVGMSDDSVPYEEGCLSLPGVYHKIDRPSRVAVQAFGLDGKPFTLQAEGLLARVIQHEYDHLSGKVFIDRLDPDEREKMVRLFERKNRRRKKR